MKDTATTNSVAPLDQPPMRYGPHDALISAFCVISIVTYDGAELKDTPFGRIWERGVRIVENGDIVEVDDGNDRNYWCRVWSQTYQDVYYEAHNTKRRLDVSVRVVQAGPQGVPAHDGRLHPGGRLVR